MNYSQLLKVKSALNDAKSINATHPEAHSSSSQLIHSRLDYAITKIDTAITEYEDDFEEMYEKMVKSNPSMIHKIDIKREGGE